MENTQGYLMFDTLKRRPLAPIAMNLGWSLEKKSTSKRWIVLKNDCEKILLYPPNERGHYLYKNLHTEKVGTAVDLLLSAGSNIKTIADDYGNLSQETYKIAPPPPLFDTAAATKKATEKISYFRRDIASSFLTKKRGIKKGILEKYNILTNANSALFPIRKNKQTISTITYNNNGLKFFQPGNARAEGGLCILYGDPGSIAVVLESPLDGLSLAQIRQEEGKSFPHIVATCGNLTAGILNNLTAINDVSKLFYSFDNDKAGEIMADKLKFSKIGQPYPFSPTRKDWNEDLMAKNSD